MFLAVLLLSSLGTSVAHDDIIIEDTIGYSWLEDHISQITIENSTIYSTCEAYLREYSKRTTEFMSCALMRARPFRVCEACAKPYMKAVTIYQDLTDMRGHWTHCKDVLLDADSIQVLQQTHDFIKRIWTLAECSKCFKTLTEDQINGTVTAKLNKNMVKFITLYNDTRQCFNVTEIGDWSPIKRSTKKSVLCHNCQHQYTQLGNFFNAMTEELFADICMDAVDIMNYTRLMWSKQFHCSNRTGDPDPIIAVAICIGLVPLIFYLGNVFHGIRTPLTFVRQKRLSKRLRMGASGADTESLYTLHSNLGVTLLDERQRQTSLSGIVEDSSGNSSSGAAHGTVYGSTTNTQPTDSERRSSRGDRRVSFTDRVSSVMLGSPRRPSDSHTRTFGSED